MEEADVTKTPDAAPNATPDAAAAAPAEAEPLLPDGVGLTLEQARALITRVHEAVVDKSDPILMLVTILNAHLAELEKLHARHKVGLARLMADKMDAYVHGVQAGIGQLTDSLSSASVEGIRSVFDDHAARLRLFKSNITWLAAIVAVSALLNVAVFVLGGLC